MKRTSTFSPGRNAGRPAEGGVRNGQHRRAPSARKGKGFTKVWAAGTAEGIAEVTIAAGTIRWFHLARSRRSSFESELLLIIGSKRGRGRRHFFAHFLGF